MTYTPATPPGGEDSADWVLLPRTPTEAMLKAARQRWGVVFNDGMLECLAEWYRAMRDAAPEPPLDRSAATPDAGQSWRFEQELRGDGTPIPEWTVYDDNKLEDSPFYVVATFYTKTAAVIACHAVNRSPLVEEMANAAQACVDDYPIASGKIVTDEGDGYGSIRQLRIALAKFRARESAP